MRALETFVIYVAPFLIIGIAAKLLMKRRSVDYPMFKRRRDRTAERARCSSWVVGARKSKAASIGGLFHTKPAMTSIGTTFRTRRHFRRTSAIGGKAEVSRTSSNRRE